MERFLELQMDELKACQLEMQNKDSVMATALRLQLDGKKVSQFQKRRFLMDSELRQMDRQMDRQIVFRLELRKGLPIVVMRCQSNIGMLRLYVDGISVGETEVYLLMATPTER